MFKLLFVFFASVLLISCSPTKKSTVTVIGSWINKEKIPATPENSVFIVVLTQDMSIRSTMESELAAAATANGVKAIQSLSVLTPVTGVDDSIIIEAFKRTVIKSGCSSVLIVTLLDSKNDTKYIPSSSYSYQPYPHYGYYGTYYSYYGQAYNTISTPGYYVTDNTYYIESNLYDVATQDILFSIQTKAVNPNDMGKASKQFAETLVDDLKSNGLLKKRS